MNLAVVLVGAQPVPVDIVTGIVRAWVAGIALPVVIAVFLSRVREALARVTGIPSPIGIAVRRVELDCGADRRIVLGSDVVLVNGKVNYYTSPALIGSEKSKGSVDRIPIRSKSDAPLWST